MLATLRNCSNRLRGRKVMMLYLDVITTFPYGWGESKEEGGAREEQEDSI